MSGVCSIDGCVVTSYKPGGHVWALVVLGALENEGDMASLCHLLSHGGNSKAIKFLFHILLRVSLARAYLEMYTFMQIKRQHTNMQ